MEQTKSKICTKFDVNIAFLKANTNILHEEIENQIIFFKSADSILRSSIMSKMKSVKIILTILPICLGIFLLIQNSYIKAAIATIGSVTFILIIRSIIAKTKDIKKQLEFLDSREVVLNFNPEPYWNHIKKSDYYTKDKIYNIFSNAGYVYGGSNFLLFPNFACQYDSKGLSIFAGKSLINKMTYETNIVHESQGFNYKYKKLEYQQWQYQRKDGGPDRRYSNNRLISYYRYHMMRIGGIPIEIESRKYYDDLRFLWNFEVNRKIIDEDNKKHDTDQTHLHERMKAIEPISFNWKDLNSIESYLNSKRILFNNYGESIEFEFKEKTYIVDNKGIVKNCSKNVKDVVEEVYDRDK
ncbi:MAG: hypothetical protein RBQ97_09165 [Acholeplasma sp.]|nr:hypothetical protein [Acholeplasma sp.]